jgi:hypothetical protein
MRYATCALFLFFAASTAEAQGPYVGVSAMADIVLMSGSGDNGEGAEAFGFALRLGVPLDDHWGIELEFARSGETDISPQARILGDFPARSISSWSSSVGSAFATPDLVVPVIFPTPEIEVDRQLSTISTLLWWRHEVNERVDVAYLGGVAFTRAALHSRISYPFFPMPLPRPIPIPTDVISSMPVFESDSVSYGADVSVGVEGRIGMTDHVRLTPGIRMQTVDGGWLIRPAVGLQWVF